MGAGSQLPEIARLAPSLPVAVARRSGCTLARSPCLRGRRVRLRWEEEQD